MNNCYIYPHEELLIKQSEHYTVFTSIQKDEVNFGMTRETEYISKSRKLILQ